MSTTAMRQLEWLERSQPKLRSEPEDRRAMAVGRFMEADPAEAYAYFADEITNEWMVQLAKLVLSGDKHAAGELVMKLACGPAMCDAAERFFGGAA